MSLCRIRSRDNLFRASVSPLCFGRKGFNAQKMLHITDDEQGHLSTSVVWEMFAPNSTYVHEYGLRLANRRNQNTIAKKGQLKEENRSIYAGSYHVGAQSIRNLAIAGDIPGVKSSDIIHQIEDEEIAHANLIVEIHGNISNTEALKTEIVDYLWKHCAGPIKPTFDKNDVAAVQAGAKLAIAPKGPYHDRRPRIVRMFHRYRFLVFTILFNQMRRNVKWENP